MKRAEDPRSAPPFGGALRRLRAVGGLGSGLAARYWLSKLRGLFTSEARRKALLDAYHAESARRVVATMGQMKGAIMKLGQIASYVSDGLPQEYRALLATLQAQAPPVDFDAIRHELERELGAPVAERFRSLEPVPLAAASIGQVHRGVLHDGRAVAVKVQYPGVDAAIRADLANVSWLYTLVGALYRNLDPGPVVDELRERILEELDYANEARNQRAFAELWADHPLVKVPAVIASHSTARVLTAELAGGHDFAWLCAQPDEQRQRAAEVMYRFVWCSMFRHRAFNGDPHPGNYRFHADGSISFLDFGCVKFFDAATARGMRALHEHHLSGDRAAFRRQLVEFGFITADSPVSTELYYEYMGFFYEPFRHDREFTFSRAYTSSSLAHVFDRNDPRYGEIPKQSNMPRDFVFLNRLQWGLWPLLAELGARNHWHDIHREYICGAEPTTALGRVFAEAWARWREKRGVPEGAEVWLEREGPRWA
jgi:predicted unusual protein kinase regulating ubiquinone biosynthesis (AarF/ABC1/UbiB family)